MIAKLRAWLRWHKQRRQWNALHPEARRLVEFLGASGPADSWRDRGPHWPEGHPMRRLRSRG
jgi:hypothetical protein